MKKTTHKIILSSAMLLLLSGAVAPSAVAFADITTTPQSTQSSSDNVQIDQSFISKYDNAIKLVNNKFIIDESVLPSDISKSDLDKLNSVIASSNNSLQQQLKDTPKENIAVNNNSIVIAENSTVAQQEALGTNIAARSKYHEGSTYLHKYWWGYRIGISKTHLHKISTGLNVAALFPYDKWIPLGWVVSVVVGVLGISAGTAPGGVVFNYSGVPGKPYGTIWYVGWQ